MTIHSHFNTSSRWGMSSPQSEASYVDKIGLREDQKIVLLRYLASRYRGLAKQMKKQNLHKLSSLRLRHYFPYCIERRLFRPKKSLHQRSSLKNRWWILLPWCLTNSTHRSSQKYHSQCLHLVRQHIIDPQPRRRSWIHQLLLLNAESFEKGGLLWWQGYVVTRNGCLISYADSKRQLKVLKNFYLVKLALFNKWFRKNKLSVFVFRPHCLFMPHALTIENYVA